MVSSSDGADKVPVSKEQEKGRRRKQPEKKQTRLTLRSGRRKYKILREKSRLRTKGFIEEQNNIQKSALAKGEKMKSADALRHNLRAAELARMTVERESKDLNDLQEQLARHLGKKPKKLLTGHIS